jgi:hypothetical protein
MAFNEFNLDKKTTIKCIDCGNEVTGCSKGLSRCNHCARKRDNEIKKKCRARVKSKKVKMRDLYGYTTSGRH